MPHVTPKKKWRIESDGSLMGTHIYTPSGEEVTNTVAKVLIDAKGQQYVELILTIVNPELNIFVDSEHVKIKGG